MRRAAILLLILPLAGGVPALAGAARSAPVPAEWQTFDVLVDFENLPRTYSCDDLWYRFRDVLLQLGARAYMTITPYDCGYPGGGAARSPHVEVEFQLPRVLHGAATRYAQLSVVDASVRLAPGSPRSLDAHDCDLVTQLEGTLFAALPLQIERSDFHCSVSPPSFALTVDARVAAPAAGTSPAAAAATVSQR